MNYIIEIIGALIVFPFIIVEAIFKLFLLIAIPAYSILVAIVYPIIPRKEQLLRRINKLWKYSKKFKQGFYAGKLFQYWQV